MEGIGAQVSFLMPIYSRYNFNECSRFHYHKHIPGNCWKVRILTITMDADTLLLMNIEQAGQETDIFLISKGSTMTLR